jgi:hypothetical protein
MRFSFVVLFVILHSLAVGCGSPDVEMPENPAPMPAEDPIMESPSSSEDSLREEER